MEKLIDVTPAQKDRFDDIVVKYRDPQASISTLIIFILHLGPVISKSVISGCWRVFVLITDTLITDYFRCRRTRLAIVVQAVLLLAFSCIKTDACFMRTTVTIDDDLYVKLKQIAEESGQTFGQVISQLARKGLGADLSRRSEAKAEPPSETESVTVFRIMIGAAIIPGNRAAATA